MTPAEKAALVRRIKGGTLMKLRDIEAMVERNGLRIVRIAQSKRIKVTVEREDGEQQTQSFPRNAKEHHALKNCESVLRHFAKGNH